MGLGACFDALNDHLGASNWCKQVALGPFMAAQMIKAVASSKRHAKALQELKKALGYRLVQEWTAAFKLWYEDPASNPNVFEEKELGEPLDSSFMPMTIDCCFSNPFGYALCRASERRNLSERESFR